MKNFLKIYFVCLFIVSLNTTQLFAAAQVQGSGDAAVAEAIAKGDGSNNKTLNEAQEKLKDVKEKIAKIKSDPNSSTKDKICVTKDALLVSGSTIAKQISPFVYILMTILILLAIKKLFLDNPDQEKNGLSSTVIKGSLYAFFALLLSNYKDLIDWWDDSVIPEFNQLCSGGKSNALEIILLGNLLLFVFIVIKLIGALIIVVGLFELVKQDRGGKVNLQSVGLKLIGGALLLNYKYVLMFFGVIE